MMTYKLGDAVVVKKLLGVADIAAMCGVEPKTVSIWRLRYADFPEPDVTVGETAGWDSRRADEIRAWMNRLGRGRKTPSAPHVQEALRRVFVYNFMRPDDFAWAPIDFPGVRYDDGVLADGMQAKATAHLIDAIRQQGYEVVLGSQAADPMTVMHRILWDKWTEDEIGEHQFTERLFNERGQIYQGCTAFDAANYTLQRLAALDGEIRSRTAPRIQMPSWAENPPEEAGPLLEVIERLRTHAWAQVHATLQDMAAVSSVNSILQRQANAMDAIQASFTQPQPEALLPDFTGDDYYALETAVLGLIPADPGQLAGIEQAVEAASAAPGNREMLTRITRRLPEPAQLARLTPWAIFVLVSLDMLKAAPEINPNDIGVLTMILMIVLYLLPPRSDS
jgi:hypothetical protein